eukprot:1181373-Prorocentrum_minimum.AAC.2
MLQPVAPVPSFVDASLVRFARMDCRPLDSGSDTMMTSGSVSTSPSNKENTYAEHISDSPLMGRRSHSSLRSPRTTLKMDHALAKRKAGIAKLQRLKHINALSRGVRASCLDDCLYDGGTVNVTEP